MKLSNYNIRIPTTNMVIHYNSFTNEYVGMNYHIDSIFTGDKWEENLETMYPNHFSVLKDYGFIIDEDRDELAEIRLQNKMEAFASRNLHIMIFPTQDCNLKCWYCYESHIKDTLMSEEIQDRIIKLVEKKIKENSFDSLRLAFFGGEPLIGFRTIAYRVAERIKFMVESAGKKFQTFFVTNATLIDEEAINLMKEINPYFQITLDGNREKHNTVRIRKNGIQGTYDNIINAIKSLIMEVYSSQEYHSPIITLRINYDNNTLKNVDDIINDLGDIDRRAIYINFERVWQTRDSVDPDQISILKNALRKFIKAGFYVGYGCFGEKRISCPAESVNHLIVSYDGNLYRCNGRTLTKDTKEGTLDSDGNIIWEPTKQAQRLGLATFENERCLKCKMLPRCMGPCSQKLIEHGGIDDSICTLGSIDTTLNDYLKLDFQMKLILNSNNNV